MQNTDITEFIRLLTTLSALYGRAMNELLIELYWQSLRRFDLPAVKNALQAHVNNPDKGQFMPKPADVVCYLEGSSMTQGLQAWSRVLQAVRSVGTYHSVVFDDPIIHAVIADMGGWLILGKLTKKETSYKAHEFEKRYSAYVLHPPSIYPPTLIGLAQQQNGARGYMLDKPVLIGNKTRAMQVYAQGIATGLPVHALDEQQANETHLPKIDFQQGRDSHQWQLACIDLNTEQKQIQITPQEEN